MMLAINALCKRLYATSVHDDPAFHRKLTNNAYRFWRLHRMLYSKRVFAAPQDEGVADAPWHMPQWIGTADVNGPEQYPIRGFYLPNDEEGMLYYGNRRLEQSNPEVYRELAQFKASSPGNAMSPTRGPARSMACDFILTRGRSESPESMWSNWSQTSAAMRNSPP
jgi:hypothetical protein